MCWPSSGAGRRIAARRRAQLDRDAEPVHGARLGVLHLHHHLTRERVRVGDRLLRSRGSGRRGRPLRAARRPSRRVSRAASAASSSATSSGRLRHAVGVVGEARVVDAAPRARSPRTAAATASGCCRRRRCGRRACAAPGRARRCRCAEPSGCGALPVAHSSAVSQIESAKRALEQRGVDPLALAGALARVQRAQDADRAEQAGRAGRRPGTPHLTGLPSGSPVTLITPDGALGDQVEARPLRVRAGLPEAGDRGVDQARVERAQRLVVGARAAPRRPGRKFSISTSAVSTSRCRSRRRRRP